MTGAAAARLGLRQRGVLRDGAYADIVVFDPATVRSNATYDDPRRFPDGIEHVIVNGTSSSPAATTPARRRVAGSTSAATEGRGPREAPSFAGLTSYLVLTKLRAMTPTTRLSADERRDEIVAAAMAEFSRTGYYGTSTDAIAKRAGVSQPYLFQLFGTKKDLFIAAVRHGFGRTRIAFEATGRRARAEDPSTEHVLKAIGLTYCDLLRDRQLLLCQLQAYAACSDPEIREAVGDEFIKIHRAVGELVRRERPGTRRVVRDGHAHEHGRRDRPGDGRGGRLHLRVAREDRRCPMTPARPGHQHSRPQQPTPNRPPTSATHRPPSRCGRPPFSLDYLVTTN